MKNKRTFETVLLALFTAIIILMAFTPLGYIPLVVINATIIHIPVILGAILLGPKKGAVLGFVFGATSCLINTIRPSSVASFVFSPVLSYQMTGSTGIAKSMLICFIPRILTGIIPFIVYRYIQDKTKEKGGTVITVLNIVMSFIAAVCVYLFINRLAFPEKKNAASYVISIMAGIAAGVSFLFVLLRSKKAKSAKSLPFLYAGMLGSFTNTLFVMGGIYLLYKDAYSKALGVASDMLINVIMGVVTFNGVLEAVIASILVSALGMTLLRVSPVSFTNARTDIAKQ